MDNIKKHIPSKKFVVSSMGLFPVYWLLNVIAFDILNLPAWIWYTVIAIVMYFVRYNIYEFWVYRRKYEKN